MADDSLPPLEEWLTISESNLDMYDTWMLENLKIQTSRAYWKERALDAESKVEKLSTLLSTFKGAK